MGKYLNKLITPIQSNIVDTDLELKPCPFCGGKAYMFIDEDGEGYRRLVIGCEKCMAEVAGAFGDEEIEDFELAENWNKRV